MIAVVDQRHKGTPSRKSIAKNIQPPTRGYAGTAENSAGSASGHDCHAIRDRTSSRVTRLATLHVPKRRQGDQPGCARGRTGLGMTEFSAVPAYNLQLRSAGK